MCVECANPWEFLRVIQSGSKSIRWRVMAGVCACVCTCRFISHPIIFIIPSHHFHSIFSFPFIFPHRFLFLFYLPTVFLLRSILLSFSSHFLFLISISPSVPPFFPLTHTHMHLLSVQPFRWGVLSPWLRWGGVSDGTPLRCGGEAPSRFTGHPDARDYSQPTTSWIRGGRGLDGAGIHIL